MLAIQTRGPAITSPQPMSKPDTLVHICIPSTPYSKMGTHGPASLVGVYTGKTTKEIVSQETAQQGETQT